MPSLTGLPYRLNVGAALFGPDGRVLVARRKDIKAESWQMPQGGIDEGEDPAKAVFRELREEIGTDRAEIIAEHPDWLQYDLPEALVRKSSKKPFRGQRQKWFALRFLGADADIVLDADPHPEFDAWRWADIAELPGLAVWFKRPVYEAIARDFAVYARPLTP